MAQAEPPSELSFHYIKGSSFHAVHADGVTGGVTPRGAFHLAFFTERAAIPQETVHELGPEGELGPEKRRVGKIGIVRELQVDAYMSVDTAESISALIADQVAKYKEAVRLAKEE
jgi:hypothetical protein